MKNGARLRARSCEGRLHGSGIPGLRPWFSTAASAAAFSVHPGLRVLSASLLWNLSDLGWREVTGERTSRTPESQARGCTGGDFTGVTEAWGPPRTTALRCDQGCRFLGKGALLCWPVLSPQDGTPGGGGGAVKTQLPPSPPPSPAPTGQAHRLFAQPSPPCPLPSTLTFLACFCARGELLGHGQLCNL